MNIICPTVLASDAQDYQAQMNKIADFSERIQIDLTDGVFAGSATVALEQVWWPELVSKVDLHLMYKDPTSVLKDVIRLKPHMAIVHAEADGQFIKISHQLKKHGIKTGVAILAKTSTHVLKPAIASIDHVLIFSGDLGKFGGIADLSLLDKVKQLKEWRKDIEIGWDGGVNDKNAKELADSGVNVLNVGGFIQNSPEPKEAYEKLVNAVA